MDTIRSYLFSVITAAVICGIVTRLMGEKGTQGAMVKLLAGLFLTFTVIRPVAQISLDGIADLTLPYAALAQAASDEGVSITKETLGTSIKARTEAYILDKAKALNVSLAVEVELSEDDIPVPIAVRLTGAVSPYRKQQLQAVIAEELGIDKERQTWI